MTATSPALTPPRAVDPAVAPLPPGPGRLASPTWLLRMRGDVLGTFDRLTDRYGDVVLTRVGSQRIAVVRGAEAARHMFVTHQDHYGKAKQFDLFRPALGEGLVTSSGDRWRTSRRIVQPLFAARHLGVYGEHMAAAAGRALDGWDRDWTSGRVVRVDRELLHVGLDTVGRALVSHDFTADADGLEQGMADALTEIGRMSRSPGVLVGQDVGSLGIVGAARLTTPLAWRRYVRAASRTRAVIVALVDARMRDGHTGRPDDLLDLLIAARDPETGRPLDREQVIDEVVTFIAAGHETTAHGLTWMFHLLGREPEARVRLHEEVDTVLGGRLPADADVETLPWFAACFQEAMRILPPVWHLPRLTGPRDDVLCGVRIPGRTRVMFSVWSTHRDARIYLEPLAFRPERWLDDAARERPRLSYLPFGAGRRACVGQGFALRNAVILGAAVAQRWDFHPVDDRPVAMDPTITLRPTDGVTMVARRR